nr:MAG TPA: hypothetical protein [Crassvirales sp.]
MIITIIVCITLVALAVISAILYYLTDKSDKEYNEYCNCLSDILDDISYHISLIEDDDVFGDAKLHVKNIKRLCNKVQDGIV